ncbi:MAG: peptidoglycan-binding protein [Polyangiaceae bacterium]
MPSTHVVRQGECLASIADRYGFADWRRVYDHPSNTELRQARPDPHVLFPGDVVEIPDHETTWVSCATERTHEFVVRKPRVFFRLRLKYDTDEPIAGKSYRLELGDTVFEGKTAGDGLIEHPVPVHVERGLLELWLVGSPPDPPSMTLPVKLGHLDPVDTPSGVLARLANLGFYSGAPSDELDEDAESALAAFQEKHGIEVTGQPCDATRKKLRSLAEGN